MNDVFLILPTLVDGVPLSVLWLHYRPDDRRTVVRLLAKARNILSLSLSLKLWDPHRLISNVYRRHVTAVNRPRIEAVHSPSSSVEVKHRGSYTSNLPYAFTACCRLSYDTHYIAYCVKEYLQASTTVSTRSSLFWDVTQRRLLVTDVSGQPIDQIFNDQACPLKMGPIGSP